MCGCWRRGICKPLGRTQLRTENGGVTTLCRSRHYSLNGRAVVDLSLASSSLHCCLHVVSCSECTYTCIRRVWIVESRIARVFLSVWHGQFMGEPTMGEVMIYVHGQVERKNSKYKAVQAVNNEFIRPRSKD